MTGGENGDAVQLQDISGRSVGGEPNENATSADLGGGEPEQKMTDTAAPANNPQKTIPRPTPMLLQRQPFPHRSRKKEVPFPFLDGIGLQCSCFAINNQGKSSKKSSMKSKSKP